MAAGQVRWLPEPGPGLLEEAAQAASWAGHPGRAARYMADALAEPAAAGTQDRARMLERLGRYHWAAGDPRAAVDATRRAWDLLECRPGSWPRWPTAACSWASRTRRCRWRPRPSNWPRRSAPTPSTRTAWRYWVSSRPSAVSWRQGCRPCTPLSPSPAGRAVSRAGSGPRRTRL